MKTVLLKPGEMSLKLNIVYTACTGLLIQLQAQLCNIRAQTVVVLLGVDLKSPFEYIETAFDPSEYIETVFDNVQGVKVAG